MRTPEVEIDHETALNRAELLADKLKKRQTHVRTAFFYRSNESEPAPPATQLLKNRSQDGLHVKLALFYLWSAGSENADPGSGDANTVRFTDTDIAEFFGLNEPNETGKRRVASARKRLTAHGLLDCESRPGKSPLIRLQKEDGSGSPYVPPGAAGGGGNYYSLPKEFWTKGWYLALSGPAVVAVLVLELMNRTTSQPELWVNPTFRTRYLGFSEDTWYRGVNELWAYGLVDRHRKAIRQPFEDEARRRRFTYEFDITTIRNKNPTFSSDPNQIIREDTGKPIAAI